jgi:hypothetical protein
MTTNTTSEPGSNAAIELPMTSTPAPDVAVVQAIAEPDLESRIKERRAKLMGKLGELKLDTGPGAAEARDKLKATLADLAHVLKWGVADGWASVGGPVTQKLEQWLTASTRQLATRNDQG